MADKTTDAKKAPVEKKTAAKKAPAEKKTAAKKAPAEKKVAAAKAPAEKKAAAAKAPAEKKAAAAKAPAEKKVAAKKAPAEKKAAAKKPAKKAEPIIKTILQVEGKDFDLSTVAVDALKKYKSTHKRKVVSEFVVYVKPEDNAAYFTVNGEGQEDFKVEL
jgi:hypothetical protein